MPIQENAHLEREADHAASRLGEVLPHSPVPSPEQRNHQGLRAPAQPGLTPALLTTGGAPLAPSVANRLGGHLGADFGRVRVHSDAASASANRNLNAAAFTVGEHVWLGERQSPFDLRLMAHELAHVRQQREYPGVGGRLRIQRKPLDSSDAVRAEDAPAPFLESGWVTVNEPAVVYKEGTEEQKGGAYLRKRPSAPLADPPVAWLPPNTKVQIVRQNPVSHWCAIAVVSPVTDFGYVADWLLARNPPDPEAGIVKVKPGDTPLGIAARYYSGKGFDVWGKDKRYVVNALVLVNSRSKHNFHGDSVLTKKAAQVGFEELPGGVDAPWWTTEAKAGGYIWLPGAQYLNSIYEEVRKHGGGTGSITADFWNTLKDIGHYIAYGLAFAGGLVHGFVKSLWDALAGIASMIYDILKSVFTLNIVSDVKELVNAVQSLSWKQIKESVGEWADEWAEKLNSTSPWTAGHAHGYLTGYVMAEAAVLLVSGGVIAEAKAALWSSRLGKIIKETRAFQTFAKAVKIAGEASEKARSVYARAAQVINETRAGKALAAARQAITRVLRLPVDIVENLTAEAIERLQQLGETLLKKIERLSDAAKRWLLGCASPCKVDIARIRAMLSKWTTEDIENAVERIGPKAEGAAGEVVEEKVAVAAGQAAPSLPLEEVVDKAMRRLRAKGVKGLSPTAYGSKLHAEVDAVLTETLGKVPEGWTVASEQKFSEIVKLDASTAKMTVRQYMEQAGLREQFPALPKDLLDTRIGDLKPDVFVRAPDGRALMWDLTSRPDPVHLAKTTLYSVIVGRETNALVRIAEYYYSANFWKKVKALYPHLFP